MARGRARGRVGMSHPDAGTSPPHPHVPSLLRRRPHPRRRPSGQAEVLILPSLPCGLLRARELWRPGLRTPLAASTARASRGADLPPGRSSLKAPRPGSCPSRPRLKPPEARPGRTWVRPRLRSSPPTRPDLPQSASGPRAPARCPQPVAGAERAEGTAHLGAARPPGRGGARRNGRGRAASPRQRPRVPETAAAVLPGTSGAALGPQRAPAVGGRLRRGSPERGPVAGPPGGPAGLQASSPLSAPGPGVAV